MFRRALVIGVTLVTLVSCQEPSLDDPANPGHGQALQPAGPCAARGDLTEKDDVLCNLEFSYWYRDLAEFTRLADPSFVFHFSPDDIGGTIPEQWDRVSELQATGNMFGSPPTGIRGAPNLIGEQSYPLTDIQQASWGIIKAAFVNATQPATSIALDLTFEPGDAAWISIPTGAPASPSETVYAKSAYYTIEVVAGDDTLRTAFPLVAQFIVHFTEANGDSVYRLIEWRDAP